MPRKYIRKENVRRAEWTEENLQKAIEEVTSGKLSKRAAEKLYKVPARTLSRRILSGSVKKVALGPQASLGRDNERRFVEYIKILGAAGFALDRECIRSLAYDFAEKRKLPHRFSHVNKRAGHHWLQSFLERNKDISIRQADDLSVSRAQGMNRKEVADFFNLLEQVMVENNLINSAENIFSVDKSKIQLINEPGKDLAENGAKDVHVITSEEKGETISLVACCNAAGYFLPPVLIMKGVNKKAEYSDGLPHGSKIYMSKKSAYITTELFLKWFEEHFLPHKPPTGKTILILEDHSSHSNSIELLDLAYDNGVIIICLPSHSTQALQPLDRSFFKPLKAYYNKEVNSWILRNKTRNQVGALLGAAWESAASTGIGSSGFKSRGIFPLNANIIPDHFFQLVADGEPCTGSENEDSRHSNKQSVMEKDEQANSDKKELANMNETKDNSEAEHTPDAESQISENVGNEKSHDENQKRDQNETSQDDGTKNVENGVSEYIENNDDSDTNRKMETDENEEDDDDDFNPLLLCPDISMDVEEAPVLTGATETSQASDVADSNSLFEPLFSTFVDEMTGAEISFNLTAEEHQLKESLYGPNNPIQFSKIHCTACNVHLGSALAGQTNRFVHPLLKVLICKECYHFYTSGEFEKDEDGSELYCRWCGQGGQVLCCTMCEYVFCKKCIRINFGRKKLTQVRDSDEWKCFRCDISQLKALRAMCVEFFDYIRRETARAATYSDADIVNKDLTNCCQSQNKKRQADSDKETDKEVVKRQKRRNNDDEDPDYDPFAQKSQERDSPVPSTSGVKSLANVTKPIGIQPKATVARNELSFPGQSPSSTVRIGNQVLNVKSLGTLTKVDPPIIRNTAIRTPVASTNMKVKPSCTPRTPVQAPNIRPVLGLSSAGSLTHIRSNSSKTQNTATPIMKHEWFEKTVRAAARVNSNLSYTLTQLNKAQSSASSVEQLAVVHNKLQEILSSSINSLIQIRKNLRTEFIAGIKTIRFPPKPAVDPNDDDDVIIVNPEPRTTPNTNKNIKGTMPLPALVSMKKPTTPILPHRQNRISNNSVSSNSPNKGYLKVRSFSALQTVSSECITIPDDDPPPPTIDIESNIVDEIEVKVSDKDPLGNTSKENDSDEAKDTSTGDKKKGENKESEVIVCEDSEVVASENPEVEASENPEVGASENPEVVASEKTEVIASENSEVVASENSEVVASEDHVNHESSEIGEKKDTEETSQVEEIKKSENDKNDECSIQNGKGEEENDQTEKINSKDDDISISENKDKGTESKNSQKCNGNLIDSEVVVKKEPDGSSYNVTEQPTPKIRRMLSVRVNLKKTTIVENMVKQEPLENGDN